MKNWKYIEGAKVGNETLAAHPDSAVAQEIYKIYLDNGKDENKALEVLASKYKNLPKEALKKHLKDAIKAYANIVRNSKAGNIAADITTDGNTWFVTTSDGKKKEFTSERETEAYVKKIKTGNDTPVEYAHRKPKVINDDKTGAEEFFKKLSDDVKEREKKDDADIEKVGNANLETSVEKGKLGLWNWYVHKDGTIVSGGTSSTEANAKEMARKALEKEKAGNKVGNRVIEKESEMSQELKNLLKKAPEWIKEKIQYAFSHGFTIDEKDFINAIKKEVGNEAPDDKFAYVMREFDEGKLKTPDGKVVTDPAQAKAIAYSESKKTENGLARARNAMNKKCGNSQVTLWKGNDSVLISEDGTVQYLESNSFETDRDKYGSMQEAIDDLTKKGYRKK